MSSKSSKCTDKTDNGTNKGTDNGTAMALAGSPGNRTGSVPGVGTAASSARV